MKRAGIVSPAWLVVVVVGCAANPPPSPPPSSVAPASVTPRSIGLAEVPAAPTDAGTTSVDALRSVVIGHINVERGAPGKVGGSAGAKLTIDGDLGVASAEIQRRGLRSVPTAGGIELSVQGYPVRHDAARARDRSPSFVIDFDTDDVARVKAQAAREHGESPAMRALTRFTGAYVVKKSLARGYDPASVVARRQEGDCTEHAVLLAALGRSFGYAARVVHGVVFVDDKGQLAGGSHAWVEWHDGKGWSVADATIGEEYDPLYLPLQTLENESPAFGRDLLLAVPQAVRRITLTPR
jgi:transglutaminase-like putative cysteine protease